MKKVLFILLFLAMSLFAKIDINTATVEELSKIKGIGASKANAIVEYRETNGKFKSVDELSNVKGVGPKLLETLKKEIKIVK